MNILLADDDRYILEGLSHGIVWERLPFTGRYEAKNSQQAKDIIENVDIHVVLCDIEMPGENGLQLLSWIRSRNYPIEVVILTSHPDFNYAREALSLGSLDYVLKPVAYDELSDILQKAAEKAEEKLALSQYLSYRDTEEAQILEKKAAFFQKMIVGYLSNTEKSILDDLSEFSLIYTLEDRFVIFVINISRNERLNWRDDGQIYYYLKTAVREALDKYQDGEKNIIPETLWKENINFWVVVLRVHDEPENIWYILEKTLTDTRKKLERHQLEFSAYISEIVTMRSMHRQWVAIRRMIFDRIGAGKGIFFVADFRASEETGEVTFEKDLVSLAFRENDETQMAHLVNSFILELGTQQNMSRQMIQKTIMDWQQAVFHFLEENQILAETLYANDEYIRLLNKTDQSLEDYRCFLHYLTGEAIKAVKEVNETDKLVNILKHYIDNNLQEDLSRQALANVVFLSPDYLALIFRRKTGKSVRQYVMERRMMRARDLLRFSSAPVYTIAAQVGFPSSSYFAKNFKQFYGQDPTVFRKNS